MRWHVLLSEAAKVVDHNGPKHVEVFADPTSVSEFLKTLKTVQKQYVFFKGFVNEATLYFWDSMTPVLHEQLVSHLPGASGMLPINIDVVPPRTVTVAVSRFAVSRTTYANTSPDDLDAELARLTKANRSLRALQASVRAMAPANA